MIDSLAITNSLISPCTEFFSSNGVIYKISNGITESLKSLPMDFYGLLKAELALDTNSQKGLDKLKINGEYDRINKLYECNYSHFDGKSDISACGSKLGPREYGYCENRENCLAHGLLCKIPCGLTVRQAKIAKLIASGAMDAEICAELFISQDTLRSHKNNIELKIGGKGKVSIAVWASKNLLV